MRTGENPPPHRREPRHGIWLHFDWISRPETAVVRHSTTHREPFRVAILRSAV
jgi:hypothetical protein